MSGLRKRKIITDRLLWVVSDHSEYTLKSKIPDLHLVPPTAHTAALALVFNAFFLKITVDKY